MNKPESVLTPTELADCVPQTATVVEQDGKPIGVRMTYAECQQFAQAALAKLAEKAEPFAWILPSSPPDWHAPVLHIGKNPPHPLSLNDAKVMGWMRAYTHPPTTEALVEAVELIRIFQNNMGPNRGSLTEEERILWDRATALRAAIDAAHPYRQTPRSNHGPNHT